MEILPEEKVRNLEVVRVTRYFETFAIDIWFRAEKIEMIRITPEDIKDIGQTLSADLADYIKKAVIGQIAKDDTVFVPEINIDYGIYYVSLRSVLRDQSSVGLKVKDINRIDEVIKNDFLNNADKIVDEIGVKKIVDSDELARIEKVLVSKK